MYNVFLRIHGHTFFAFTWMNIDLHKFILPSICSSKLPILIHNIFGVIDFYFCLTIVEPILKRFQVKISDTDLTYETIDCILIEETNMISEFFMTLFLWFMPNML